MIRWPYPSRTADGDELTVAALRAAASPVEAITVDLEPGWEILGSQQGTYEVIFAARHEDGRWAIGQVAYVCDQIDDADRALVDLDHPGGPQLREVDADAGDGGKVYANITWQEASPASRRRMVLNGTRNGWLEAADFLGLREMLLRSERAYQNGEIESDLEWDRWLGLGFLLAWEHPRARSLREDEATRLLVALSADPKFESHLVKDRVDTLTSAMWDWAFLAVGGYMRAHTPHMPGHADDGLVLFADVQAVHREVFNEIRRQQISAGSPDAVSGSRSLTLLSPQETTALAHDIVAGLDWPKIRAPRFTNP